jgi:hypothetical protein
MLREVEMLKIKDTRDVVAHSHVRVVAKTGRKAGLSEYLDDPT